MPAGVRTVGRGATEVVALVDAEGPFFGPDAEAFPAASPADWERAHRLDPGAVAADGTWWLAFRSHLVRSAGRSILVDAGVGPATSLASSWAPTPGRLPDALLASGTESAEVTTVVLTHLHTDHVGWAGDATGSPYFANARYVVQDTEIRALTDQDPDGQVLRRVVEPLRAAGVLDLVDGSSRLAPDVEVFATPGHTPGHQSVRVAADGDVLVVAGDVLVHAVQLVAPDVAYTFEDDPATARDTRIRLLEDLTAVGGILTTPHLAIPFLDLG